MAEMAKVAVLTEPRTFEYHEVAIPEIGPDDGILRVEAAALLIVYLAYMGGRVTLT